MNAPWPGFAALELRLARIADPDPTPFLEAARRIVVEDNRSGVLAGLDKDGRPMAPLKARRARKSGPMRPQGPPLAPRGIASPVIANLVTSISRSGDGQYQVEAGWPGVVNKAGQPYLHYHFNGDGHNPVRDLRGVRPAGRARIAQALKAWITYWSRGAP